MGEKETGSILTCRPLFDWSNLIRLTNLTKLTNLINLTVVLRIYQSDRLIIKP